MGVVLANGIITATMNFKHDDHPREFFYEKYYYIEVQGILTIVKHINTLVNLTKIILHY